MNMKHTPHTKAAASGEGRFLIYDCGTKTFSCDKGDRIPSISFTDRLMIFRYYNDCPSNSGGVSHGTQRQ